jgi:hypothetical protein
MKFDPSKPLELNMLDRPALPSDFIEETTVTMDPRPGWAPPRRRPRRVYKKLAARDFKASYKPAPRFTGRPDIQQRVTRHTAPALVAWIDGREVSVPPYRVRFLPLMFDGKGPPQLAPQEYWYRDHFVTVDEAAWPRLSTLPDDSPAVPDRIGTTWTGRSFGMGVMVNSPLAARRIEFSTVVYMPPGVDERPIRQAIERSARMVHEALMRAALGVSSAKIIARQTCYRPTEDHG